MPDVRSPASPETRATIAADYETLIEAIESSDIVVPETAATAFGSVPAGVVSGEVSPVASWASRFAPAEIDGEVLRWIASHVPGKRRLGGSLMTIFGLLITAAPLTASLGGVTGLLA